MANTFQQELNQYVADQGIGKELEDLIASLESARLTDAQRQLLSDDELFSYSVLAALADGVEPEDTETLAFKVLERVEELDDELATAIVEAWAQKRFIDLAARPDVRDRMKDALISQGLPVDFDTLEKSLDGIYESILEQGNLPDYVDKYLAKEPGLKDKFVKPQVKRAMVDFLIDTDVFLREGDPNFNRVQIEQDIIAGKYDEFFGPAYREARLRATQGSDPLDALRAKGVSADWDYTVDYFDTVADQGILPSNIRRAGAIDYVYWLGEVMGVYKIVDAIVLAWGRGELDFESSASATRLYRYLKLRDERSSVEERFMLYKRVLDRGDAEVLDRVVVNAQFPVLWHRLMSEVARFIAKSEEAKGSVTQVSATPLLQAVSDLQYNLTDYSTGLADLQIKEMYAHLREAFDILTDKEVLDYFAGGRRRSPWQVIERIARTEFETSLNVSAIRTVAVEGNRVFNWIADFRPADGLSGFRWGDPIDAGTFDSLGLRSLLEASERWIIAADELEQAGFGQPASREEKEQEQDELGDDFDDWEV